MLRKQALIAIAALGLTMGSGAALSAPVGLQGLANPGQALQETGATIQPVHYRSRRHVHVKRHFVHPRRHVLVHPRFRHRQFAPRHRFVHRHHFAPRHRFVHRRHFRSRPRVSFGLRFGW